MDKIDWLISSFHLTKNTTNGKRKSINQFFLQFFTIFCWIKKMFSTWQEYNKHILKQAWHFSKTMWCTCSVLTCWPKELRNPLLMSCIIINTTTTTTTMCIWRRVYVFFCEILLILVGWWWWPYLLLHKSSTSISHLTNKEFPRNPLPSHIKLKKKKKKSQSQQWAFDPLPILRCTQVHIFKCLNLLYTRPTCIAALDQTWPTGLPLVTLSWLHPLWQVQSSNQC